MTEPLVTRRPGSPGRRYRQRLKARMEQTFSYDWPRRRDGDFENQPPVVENGQEVLTLIVQELRLDHAAVRAPIRIWRPLETQVWQFNTEDVQIAVERLTTRSIALGDRGQQVEAGDPVVLPFAGSVPQLAALVKVDGALEGVVRLALCSILARRTPDDWDRLRFSADCRKELRKPPDGLAGGPARGRRGRGPGRRSRSARGAGCGCGGRTACRPCRGQRS